MSKPDFTPKQKQAIFTPDKNLLVSAGAGSGKTTVLTQRLINKIRSGDKVTDFLVVTFMKAAAADIKRKLYDALLAESAVDPNNKHLYRQSLLVSEANICTISAYCLSLVKENFALLGISPKVRVLDETEEQMLLRRVAESLISKGYESGDKSFLLLSDNFTGDKNDTPLADSMISLYNALRVTLNREETLEKCANKLRSEAETIKNSGFFATQTGKSIQNRLRRFYDEFLCDANELYSFAATVATDDKYLAPLERLVTAFENVRMAIEGNYVNYCDLAERSFKIKLATKGCDEENAAIVSDTKTKLMKEHTKVVKRYVRGNDAFNAESFLRAADIVESVNSFINELDREYTLQKQENGVLDYSDFELLALKLLETKDENGVSHPTELCIKKRSAFKEVLIDEYQDVNPMQDRIFTLLSGGSRRFMVGDVKQSIYRFRNAYPDIFLGYKDEYPDIDSGKDSNNFCIFLRENFRCGEAVINYVNDIFEKITNGTEYYREYEGEWLIKAATRPDKKTPVTVAIADKEKGKAAEARGAEAEYIASEITRLMRDELSDDGTPLKYSDFAVMLGAMKGYSIEYEKAFNKFGIPYKTEVTQNFLENPDIRLAISALKAIDDPTDDISLCSLLRSPICNFTSDELYKIRRAVSDTPFWQAIQASASLSARGVKNGRFSFKKRFGENCLAVKCLRFIKRFNEWRRQSIGVPCRDFIKSFFISSGLLRISSGGGNRDSLLLLYDYAGRYENAQNIGLSGFLDYIAELSSGDKIISDAARAGDEDAVSFITVHKSKGLEFKVCFLAGIQKQFFGNNRKSSINLTRGEGIYFALRDRVNGTTFDPLCNIDAVDKERESMLGEELRKLYVALTRAKERLYVTGCAEVGWQDKRYSQTAVKSWLDMVLFACVGREESDFYKLCTISEAGGNSGYRAEKAKRVIAPTPKMLEIVNYEYPYMQSVTSVKKISVSELREGLLEDDEYNRSLQSVPMSRISMRPAFASEKQISAADIGTANHLFMQFCDFQNVGSKGVASEALRLKNIRMISDEQYKMLDESALTRFFESDLYREIAASRRVYREKRFSVSDYIGTNVEPLLVQGVIDCFFENADGSYTVVDYKTDRVKSYSELVSRHRTQLSYYSRAVERMTGCRVSRTLLYSFVLGGVTEVCDE